MIENVGRKLILIGLLLATALLLLVIPDRPIRMGLDIAGGTRLVYGLDFAAARASGSISPEETDAEVLNETIAIIRNRVDPDGVLEPVIRRAGSNRIEIQLPGTVDLGAAVKPVPLAREVAAEGSGIILLGGEPAAYSAFPSGGGSVRIDGEDIRYGKRVANELREIQRGAQGTAMQPHAAGASVVLVSDDSIKNAIENLGDLRFYPVAEAANFSVLGSDATAEIGKLRAWLANPENAETPIAVYNALSPAEGGAPDGLLWFPARRNEANEALTRLELLDVGGGFEPVLETPPEWTFSGADLERVFRSQDSTLGYPAVGFEMSPRARVAFGEFTAEYVQRRLAIVLNDEVVTAPRLDEALYGTSQISGGPTGFTDAEVREMVTVLRSGSLQVKPNLEEQERVGATLGQDYVRRGLLSGLVALALTFVFMAVYYRRLGLFSCVALLANLILMMGTMVALQATLTLPGIAGMILTVGMAVDANILIFDRMREEAEKGRKPLQAAKDGFHNALSAIIDSNVTTFLTAAILRHVGSGPIRGFATTLMIGIATSMFAAVVITRVLVHLQLEKGVERWTMSRWLADANFDFIRYTKAAAIASVVAILAGLGLFVATPASTKYGIDFLGGARVKVRTEAPHAVDEIRALVARIPGDIGATAEVSALPISQTETGYREFAITFKTPAGDEDDTADHFAREIRTGLADVIQRGPIEASLEGGKARLTLYLEEQHSSEDVQQVLGGLGLGSLAVQQRAGQENVFDVTGEAQPGINEGRLAAQVQAALAGQRDASGRDFTLAEPMPEASVIGAQVVGELRDSAIRAILLSVFLVIMYIRVRFAEYSYGLAAVVAVVHDVLIALGAVVLMTHLPFVQVEINLTMIAAFLTILGYSLNDTIVIFDRVRENLPRVKGSFADVVNLSINQTLSRTIVTTLTTLFSVVVILAFNLGTGNVLEGFMLALLAGFVSGVYSTIYIACPLLIWFEQRAHRKGATPETAPSAKKAQAAT